MSVAKTEISQEEFKTAVAMLKDCYQTLEKQVNRISGRDVYKITKPGAEQINAANLEIKRLIVDTTEYINAMDSDVPPFNIFKTEGGARINTLQNTGIHRIQDIRTVMDRIRILRRRGDDIPNHENLLREVGMTKRRARRATYNDEMLLPYVNQISAKLDTATWDEFHAHTQEIKDTLINKRKSFREESSRGIDLVKKLIAEGRHYVMHRTLEQEFQRAHKTLKETMQEYKEHYNLAKKTYDEQYGPDEEPVQDAKSLEK